MEDEELLENLPDDLLQVGNTSPVEDVVDEIEIENEELPELSEDELMYQELENDVIDIKTNNYNATDQFQQGADITFSAKQMNADKYLTYNDTETYGQLGFNPFLSSVKTEEGTYKSGMDNLYDQNTTTADDIERAFWGAMKLGGIGFQDTFALGAFSDDDNYIDFEDTMAKYSSSKGGSTGFWANTLLSSGYTMGIIAGIAAEEIVLNAATAGAGAIGKAARFGFGKLGDTGFYTKASKLGKNKYLNAADEISDIDKARTWLQRRGDKFKAGAKNFGRAINPIGESVNFIRNIDKIKDFNNLKATALGAGTIVRDMRKIAMSHSESELEADMAAHDFRKKQYDDFYLDYNNLDKYGNPKRKNVGKLATDEFLNTINSEANRVYNNVYAGNFGLIYLTNAVTFDNMFKHMKGGIGRMFGYSASNAYKVVRNVATGKATVSAVRQTIGNYLRGKVAGWTIKGTAKAAVKSTLTSSMEGFQELGQDILSESFKDYHSRNVRGTQIKGGFMHYLKNDLVHAIKKQNSGEGLSTFLSGMFMGVFASPVGFATGQINTFINGGGFISAQGTYQKIFQNEKYKKSQESEFKKLEEEAEFLTKFFNENKNFLQSWSKPMARQVEIQEEMLDASRKGHKERFKNAQNESFTNGVKRVLNAGLAGQFKSHLNYMATELNATELSELMARTDITEENIDGYRKKLLDNAELLGSLELKHKEIQQNFRNPVLLSELDATSENYIKQYIDWAAFESLKDELLFNHSKIVDRAKRLKEIRELIKNENPLIDELNIDSLLNIESLNETIKMLKAEVEANEDLTLTGDALINANNAKRRLKALENYKIALVETEEAFMNSESSETEEEIFEEIFEAYSEVVRAFGKNEVANENAQEEISRKQFDQIFDFIMLEKQQGEFIKHGKTLLTDSGGAEFVNSNKDMLTRLEENKKEHIKNSLIEFSKLQTSNEMLKELYDAGVFFDMRYLDDLLSNRVMPSELIDLVTNETANAEKTKLATEIVSKYIKRLTGKPLIKSGIKKNSQGRKLKQDKRTVAGILRQYGIKLNSNINLSSKAGLKLINRLAAQDNKFLTPLDREILLKVVEQEATIRFVDDQTLPIQIDEAGIISIDVRFAGEDYANSAFSIENLMVTALTQNKILNDLIEDDDLFLQARDAMRQAKKYYARLYPKENVDEILAFNSVDVFLSEALNDIGFQALLQTIEDKIQPTKKSLWSSLKTGSESIIEKKFENKLVNRVFNIAAKAIDESIVDNISEINIKVRTDEAQEKLDKKFEELKIMGSEMGKKWNVNVKVLKDQQEAQELLDKIENPFYDKEDQIPSGFYDEKTNTAYIIAEDVKENTPYHEIFLHPFLINAEKKNNELYKSLVAEAKADQSVVDYVEKNYGTEESIGSRQYEHELVGRVYSQAVANEINQKEKPGLFKRIFEFMKLMLKETGMFLKIMPRDINRFKANKTTIKDLAKFSAKNQAIDLGAIIEDTKEVKPKKEKVKVKKTVTKEIQENVGGNTVVMNEARDQPSLMEDFINDDIQLENAESVNAATDEIVALGQEFDALDVSASNTSDLVEVEKGKTKLPLRDNLGSGEQKTLKTEYAVGTNGALGVYVNEQTGSEDVFLVIPNKNSDKDYIGYKRVYKDGKPTNEFSIKGSMTTAEKGTSKISFEAVNKVLPEGAVLTETTNISTDGLTLWANQIKNGYKILEETITVDVNTDGTKINLGGTKSGGDFSKANFTEQELVKAEAILNDLIKDWPGAKIKSRKITPIDVKDALYSIKITIPKLEKPKKEDLKTTTKEANWKFGDLRVEVDGRLIIDVYIAGKRFLMYKSTGTGTTADTAGEWTPLLYFGTRLKTDGSGERSEWFVKALFEGQDPKKNKYNSKTFAELDKILKEQESELFTGPEQIQTRTETEEIEVEEEVVEEKQEVVEDATPESIQNRIDNLTAQIETIKEDLKQGKGTIIQRRRMSSKVIRLQAEANELYKERAELLKKIEKEGRPVLESDEEYVPIYDVNKNEIITSLTPWGRIPEALKEKLAELYGKKLDLLNQQDVDAISELIETSPEYIKAVNDYQVNRRAGQDKLLLKQNQEKVDRAKAKRQAELAAQRKDKKGKKVKLSLEEKIKQLPGAELLSEDEVTNLANQIRNQEGIFPFGFQEVRNIITEKRRAEEISKPRLKANMTAKELKELEEQEEAERVKFSERQKKKKQIEDNIRRLGKSGSYNAYLLQKIKDGQKTFKRNVINIPNGMRQFILKYHPEIFSLDQENFNVQINNIMRNYRNTRKRLIPANFKFKSTDVLEILEEVKELMNRLDSQKQLYPSVVVQINRALNETEATYTIKRLGSKQLRNSSSMYDLKFTPNKKSGADVIMPERRVGTSAESIIKNADITDIRFRIETQAAIALGNLLLAPGAKLSREFFESIDEASTKQGKYDSFISENVNKQLTGIGQTRIKSAAALGELLEQTLADFLNLSVEQVRQTLDPNSNVPGQGFVESFMQDVFTKKQLRQSIADAISDNYQEAENNELDFMSEEEAALKDYVEFSNTEEGKKIIEEEMASKAKDFELYQEMIIQEELEKEQSEEKEKDLYDIYFDPGTASLLRDATSIKQELEIISNEFTGAYQGNLAFVVNAMEYVNTLKDSKQINAKQYNSLLNIVEDMFTSGLFDGQAFETNSNYRAKPFSKKTSTSGVYIIEKSTNGFVSITELNSNATDLDAGTIKLNALLKIIQQPLLAGTIVNGQQINTVANPAEIRYIKDATFDYLNNFASYTKEAEALSDEQLLEDLKTEINKCK